VDAKNCPFKTLKKLCQSLDAMLLVDLRVFVQLTLVCRRSSTLKYKLKLSAELPDTVVSTPTDLRNHNF